MAKKCVKCASTLSRESGTQHLAGYYSKIIF